MGYPQADLVLGDYVAAQENSESNKAHALLLLGEHQPEPSKLKSMRQKLAQTDDNELEWVSSSTTLEELEKGLLKAEVSEQKASAPVKEKKNWYEVMMGSLKEEGVAAGTIDLVRKAYETLGEYKDRLRTIWMGQPESLEAFCLDAVDLADSEAYSTIMMHYSLFKFYKKILREGEMTIREVLSKLEESEYKDVSRVLKEVFYTGDYLPPLEQEEVPNAEVSKGEIVKCDRIIVWGERYKTDSKERTMEAVDVPVEVFDYYNRRSDITGIRPEDVVIWVTTNNNHPSYHLVKEHCRKNEIGFYHFNQGGSSPLIAFLQESFSADT